MQPLTKRDGYIRINGVEVSAVDARFRPGNYQSLLAGARESGDAVCLCSDVGLRLSIKKRGKSLHLAAWPDQGGVHATDCPFYSGSMPGNRGVYPGSVVDGRGQAVGVPAEEPAGKSVDLWDVMHSLWACAGLNKWQSGWRRDWGLARSLLLRAAAAYECGGARIASRLYIPPVFSQEKKQAINDDWAAFTEFLMVAKDAVVAKRDSHSSGYLLGVVASIEPCSRGVLMRLQHHYSKIFVTTELFERLSRLSRRGWNQLQIQQQSKSSVVALLEISPDEEGRLTARDCVLMRVGARFIPSNFEAEDLLLSKLLEEGRSFERPLSFAQSHKQCANFVLTDTPTRKTELHLTGGGFPVHRIDAWVKERTQIASARGCNVWFWHKPEPLGVLPAANARAAS